MVWRDLKNLLTPHTIETSTVNKSTVNTQIPRPAWEAKRIDFPINRVAPPNGSDATPVRNTSENNVRRVLKNVRPNP